MAGFVERSSFTVLDGRRCTEQVKMRCWDTTAAISVLEGTLLPEFDVFFGLIETSPNADELTYAAVVTANGKKAEDGDPLPGDRRAGGSLDNS